MISSRFGCALKILGWKVYEDGTVSDEIVRAIRISDGAKKEYHISDLRADNGIEEIMQVLNR